jgi:hypothetical protein
MGLFFKELDTGVLTVCAVTRGSGALDGVDSTVLRSLGTQELSEFLRESKQIGQTRVIVYESMNGVDPNLLSESLRKPVLELVPKSNYDEMFMVRFHGIVVKPVGIDGGSTLRVLKVISRGTKVFAVEFARKIGKAIQ